MTSTPHTQTISTPDARGTAMTGMPRVLRIAGWSNIAIATAHVVGLIWAWSFFRAVGIEPEMRELAAQGAALPHILTLITAAAFLVFGLYALSGAGDLRRLPLLRAGLAFIAVVYLYRATLYGGVSAVRDGDGTQMAFAAIALLIGLGYACGAIAHRRMSTDQATSAAASSPAEPSGTTRVSAP